jgi:uncharacterized membrane protein/protein-disulfide isomerase
MSLVPKAPVAPSQPAPVFNTPTRWVLRVLSWLAFLIAAYLAWGSITNMPIAGCGIGTHAGCDAVLNSPWAKWIVVPVSVAGLACYAGLAGLSVLLGIRDPRASRWITTAFVMLATVAAGASLWFIALQVFAIGEFCWYCLTTDACGIAIGALTSWSVFRAQRATQQFARVRNSSAGMGTLRSALPAGPRVAPVPGVVRTPAPVRAQSAFPSLAIAYGGAAVLLLVFIGGQIAFRAETYEVQQVTLTESIDISGNGKESVAAANESDEASTRVAMRIPADEADPIEQPTDVEAAAEPDDNEPSDAERSPGSSADDNDTPPEPKSQTSAKNRAADAVAATTASTTPARERKVKLLNGKLTLDVYKHPCIGNPEAPNVVAELISYDCPHCRKTHRLMKQAMARYGDQVALIVLVVPLEKSCNRLFKTSEGSHAGACTTARMALGIAKLKPASFGRFHDYLMSGSKDKPPALDSIIAKAYSTVNREQLRKLRESDELNKQIASTVDLFDSLSKQNSGKKSFGLPVQIVGNEVMSGSIEKADDIYKVWEKNLNVKPR